MIKKRLTILLFIFYLVMPSMAQTTIEEDAYKLFIKAIQEKNLSKRIEIFNEYLNNYAKLGLMYDKFVYMNLAFTYNDLRRFDKVVESGEKALSFSDLGNMERANLLNVVAGAYAELNKNLEKALNYSKTAIQIASNSLKVESQANKPEEWKKVLGAGHFVEGSIYFKRKEYKNGLDSWTKAYKELRAPEIIKEIRKNGKSFYADKKFGEAEMFFRTSYELSKDPECAYWYGKTNYQLSHKSEALEYFKIAYSKKKDSEIAYNIGILLLQANRPDEAFNYLSEASVLNNSKFSGDARKLLESEYFKKFGNIDGIPKLLEDAKKRLGIS
ncbi:MAG: hypothetical protein AB1410_04425 [Acidobacteriota bacterium]